MLGAVLTSPSLTEKLLKKPPFRFIHDIIMSLHKSYGFAKGLLTAEEMDAKWFEAKEQKIVFLEKLIQFVMEVTQIKLPVRASKITSGSEV